MSKVSVIIPLYNSAQHLPSLFENIARQSIAADLEFVFIDDHGCDDGAALARSLAAGCGLRCIFGATVANSGPGGARNVGLGIAGGEYIAFLEMPTMPWTPFSAKNSTAPQRPSEPTSPAATSSKSTAAEMRFGPIPL